MIIDNLVKWHTPKNITHLTDKSLHRYSMSARMIHRMVIRDFYDKKFCRQITGQAFDRIVRNNTPLYTGELSLQAYRDVRNHKTEYKSLCKEHIHGLKSCFDFMLQERENLTLAKIYKLLFKFNVVRKTTSIENRHLMKFQTGIYCPDYDPYVAAGVKVVEDIFTNPKHFWAYKDKYYRHTGEIAELLGLSKNTLDSAKYKEKHNITMVPKTAIYDMNGDIHDDERERIN